MSSNELKEQPSFDIVRIQVRTTNDLAIKDNTIIDLWQRFFHENWLKRIPNKIDHDIIAVYYDYARDRSGKYNILIGCKVRPSKSGSIKMPIDAWHINMAAHKARIFTLDLQCVGMLGLWKRVWQLEDEKKINRSYSVDYEIYPKIGTPTLYIGVN